MRLPIQGQGTRTTEDAKVDVLLLGEKDREHLATFMRYKGTCAKQQVHFTFSFVWVV